MFSFGEQNTPPPIQLCKLDSTKLQSSDFLQAIGSHLVKQFYARREALFGNIAAAAKTLDSHAFGLIAVRM